MPTRKDSQSKFDFLTAKQSPCTSMQENDGGLSKSYIFLNCKSPAMLRQQWKESANLKEIRLLSVKRVHGKHSMT